MIRQGCDEPMKTLHRKLKKDDARLRRRKSTAVVCSFFQSQRRTEKERERVFNDLSRSPADEWVS